MPAAKLTCTLADPLHQCSRFHHSCICMQEALEQEAQWLQMQKPGIQRIKSHHSTKTIHKQPSTCGEWIYEIRCRVVVLHKAAGRWSSLAIFVVVYLHRSLSSQYSMKRSLVGRRRCTHQGGGGTGDCTHSYRGWTLTKRDDK